MNGAPQRAPVSAALARAVLARPWPAGVLAGSMLTLALAGAWMPALIVLAPFATLASGALTALLVLAIGSGSIGPLAAGGGFALAMMVMAGVSPLAGAVLIAAHAGAIAVLAGVWRASRSLALTLTAAALGAMAVAVGGALRLDEPARAARRQALEQWFGALVQADEASLRAALDTAVTLSGGLLGLSLLVSWVLALVAARSLQAAAVAPGAFTQEFRVLRLGRGLSVAAAGVMALAAVLGLAPPALAAQAAVVLVALFAVQGLAVLHALAAARALWPGLLWLVYGALVVASVHAAAVCALLGLVDNWVDFRARVAVRRGS